MAPMSAFPGATVSQKKATDKSATGSSRKKTGSVQMSPTVTMKSPKGKVVQKKPCAFFAKSEGCRNGDKCTFLHGKVEENSNKRTQSSPSPSVSQSAKKRQKKTTPKKTSKTYAQSEPSEVAPAMHKMSINGNEEIKQKGNDTAITSWDKLIAQTRQHPRFSESYAFPDEGSIEADEWLETRACGEWCAHLPHVVGIDCEMCVTANEDGSGVDKKSLIRVSVVNGTDPSQVLTDFMVKQPAPGRLIVDAKTTIHGISGDRISNAEYSFRDAQSLIRKLVCKNTVVIGHSLNSDLQSLKLRHARVIDTALIFKLQGVDIALGSPGLKDVAKALLSIDMPEPHDSIFDAEMAVKIARLEALNGPSGPIPRAGSEANLCKLRVHRVFKRADTNEQSIAEFFKVKARVVPVLVEALKWKANRRGEELGSTVVTFSSKVHADLAFDTLDAVENIDKFGRRQKAMYLLDCEQKDCPKVQIGKMEKMTERVGAAKK